MTVEAATDILREALTTALMVAGPMLIVGLVVGLMVSIFQAVTQIQEQTLSFVPKIVAMMVTLILIIPWIGVRLLEFSERMFML